MSPEGDLTEEVFTLRSTPSPPPTLEAQGSAAGFTSLPSARGAADTRDYVGSTVVLLEAPR